jgi:hypothetical protein
MKRVCLALVLAIMSAGCGPIPQPFQGTQKVSSDIAMLDVPSAVGIAIVPISGLPQPLNDAFTKAIAGELKKYEIPAEATAINTGLGFTLQGSIIEPKRQDGLVNADVLWRLKSRRGADAGVYLQAISVPAQDWDTGSAATAAALGRDAAAAIAGIIDGSTNQAAGGVSAAPSAVTSTEAPKPLRITVKPVEGAPGDGQEALQLATLEVLLTNGAKRDDINPEVVLMSRVEIEPSINGQDFVTIIWRAISQDGTDLGEVKLTNTIPRGALEARWGPTAFAIADAGLPQLLQLLTTAPRF